MNNNETYYGKEKSSSISFLEFGSIDINAKSKKVWGYWQDQEAYDLYMFSRYARDLFAFRHFIDGTKHTIEAFYDVVKHSAHDKLLDYIFKYAGLISSANVHGGGTDYVCESGSSLYGLIDETIACDYVFNSGHNVNKIKSLSYLASDISTMMNEGAKAFHMDVKMESTEAPTISDLVSELSDSGKKLAYFYGLSVSLRYALREANDIVKLMGCTEFGMFNRLSLSFGKDISATYGTGKTVYIVSLPALISGLKDIGCVGRFCTENIQRNKDGEDTIRASIIIAHDSKKLDAYIDEYYKCIDKAKDFVPGEKGEWLPLEQLMEKQ